MGTGTIAQHTTRVTRGRAGRKAAAALLGLFTFFAGLTGAGVASTEAAAQTRTLNLYYTHTKKSAKITFKKNGRYLKSGLQKANKFLADWRTGQQIKIDPRLLDTVWEVYQKAGTNKPIHVVSSYRSPKTNAMLRRTRGGQAKKSQHMVGRAMDFFIPGVSPKKLRKLGLQAQSGGVGYYPKSGFVHLDTGRVRHWPRMSRSQLVKVFPKGGTLHVPSDGKALPGYKTAQADYKRRMANGGSTALRVRGGGGGGGNVITNLFRRDGSGDSAVDTAVARATGESAPTQIARLPRRGPKIGVRAGRPAIRTVDPSEVAPLPGVETGADVPAVEAPAETIVASLPEIAPTPVFRPGGAGEAVIEPTVSTLIADAADAAPRPIIRARDAGATAVAAASANPLVTAYAADNAPRPAARALARIGGRDASEVAAASLAREDTLLAAIGRTKARLGTATTPSAVTPDSAARSELTENALRLAFARSTTNVAARRTELLAKLSSEERTRAPLAATRLRATPAASTSLTPARPAIADIDPSKINALAAALRRQAGN